MKTIRKSFLLLAFAAGAMFVIGNNVFADPTVISNESGYSCSVSVICSDGGSVSCTGTNNCSRWSPHWVSCDGKYTYC